MAKNIQWKKSTIDYDKLNELTPRALAAAQNLKNAKKGAETKRKRGTDEVGWNKIRKINEELADEIRSKYIPRKYTMTMLAAEYGVGYQTIRRVVTKTITLKK